MELFIIIFIIVAVVIALQTNEQGKREKVLEDKLFYLTNFTSSQKVMGVDGKSGIAVDEVRKKICLIKLIQKTPWIKKTPWNQEWIVDLDMITYQDIISSEIYEDSNTITRTSRTSQLGGMLVGGLALGGGGALIGGLTGKKSSSDKINKIDLRIAVNRTSNPFHDIEFMSAPVKKNGLFYNKAIKQARHWHGLLGVIIKQADAENVEKSKEMDNKNLQSTQKGSVSEELLKLADLQKQGLITDGEFQSFKTKLLE